MDLYELTPGEKWIASGWSFRLIDENSKRLKDRSETLTLNLDKFHGWTLGKKKI